MCHTLHAEINLLVGQNSVPRMHSGGINIAVERHFAVIKVDYSIVPVVMMRVDVKHCHGTGSYPLPPQG